MTPASSAAEALALVPVMAPTPATTAEKSTAAISSAMQISMSVRPRWERRERRAAVSIAVSIIAGSS